ncbi:hypothetical protein BC936DRAFT_142353 [Jimgerdemannia flammicorona]|uniref:Alcohol dehydrogenase-like C-terminal domain-containing protein n=1 Tax=Jimgerdemannia flammicorona TaxID=994334 RepID=A0A433A0I4_9FUNG|nr:hypothetical protein BC936DRAFT_142353 [Jimgerdemannia flammicorona]
MTSPNESRWRGHHRFTFKVPEKMTNEDAATFFCAGVTTYNPLKTHNVGPGSKVGIVGIGGLGHFGIQFAKVALGAEVYAISSSDRKKEDAKALGAHHYLVSSGTADMKKHTKTLTHILCTSFGTDFPWAFYLSLLRTNGKFILVGLPEAPISGIRAGPLVSRQISIVGSIIGSPRTIREMLEFAVEKGVKPWIQKYPMADVNVALKAMHEGKARYRFVLEN